MILTKPVSRTSVIISKFISQSVLISSSVIIGATACYLYTLVLFNEGNLKLFTQSMILYLVYYLLLVAVTLFFSTLFANQIAAGGLSLIFFFGLTILPSLSELMAKFSPYVLTIIADNIVKKGETFSKSGWPIILSLILIAAFLFMSCVIFNRQEL